MALSVISVKDLGFVKQFKLSDGRVVRESELAGLGLSTPPPRPPTPPNPPAFNPQNGTKTETEETVNGGGQDTDTFTPPPSPEVTNTTLSVDEVNKKNNNEPAGNLNADATDGDDDGGNDDYDSPEPPKSATDASIDNFSSTDSKVAAPTGSENTMTAGGKATKASNKQKSGLTANLDTFTIDPRPNDLSNFASFTYNIALYMMSPKRYVELVQNPTSIASVPKQLLMRSGGVGSDGGENFDIDFFIDNLQMTNMASSPSTSSSNTNAVDISFDITEPMGMTLLARLKEEATNSLEESENYVGTPYLLELTFKGYDDQGKEISGAIKPKHIPIKINEIRFKLESSGTVYKCRAVPYHQDILSSMTSTIPINVQVSAGTVSDIFGGTAQRVHYEEETITKGVEDQQGRVNEQVITSPKTVLGERSSTLVDAINKFYEAQTKPAPSTDPKKKGTMNPSDAEAGVAESWSFAIAPEIAQAKLVGSRFDALNTPQKTSKVYKQASAGLSGQVNLDSKTNLFKINAATNVVSLINYIIVASDYIDSNIINELDNIDPDNNQNKEVTWFKVVPQITEFKGWDSKQGRYKFHVTWTVMTTGLYYVDFPWAAKSMPKGKGIHKEYDYIFTGNNTEITQLHIDFDTAYYQAHQIGTGIPVGDKDVADISPTIKVLPQSKQGQGIINDETDTKKRGKDLMSSIMHDGTDTKQIDLSILGDPAFIPVGDAYFQPQGNQGSVINDAFLPDGTINYDLTPPYIQLNFKTPSDYDEMSGLVDLSDKNSKYSSSEFGGVYRVVQVQSNFSGGVFDQKIKAVREDMQPIDGKVARNRESLERATLSGDLMVDSFNSLVAGFNPASKAYSRRMEIKAYKIQLLADENDQGQFEEGIGDEEPPLLEVSDNGRIISPSETADTFVTELSQIGSTILRRIGF